MIVNEAVYLQAGTKLVFGKEENNMRAGAKSFDLVLEFATSVCKGGK